MPVRRGIVGALPMMRHREERNDSLRHMGLAEDPDRFNAALIPFPEQAFAASR